MTSSERQVSSGQEKDRYARYFRDGAVHRDLYINPDLFAAEMGSLFGSTWVYIGHETELPKPNDFIRRRIGRRPVIFVKKDNGEVDVLINRCPHRGALICRFEKGNAKRFTCGYHAWSFENDGKCVAIPIRHAYGEDFDVEQNNLLKPARVDSYRGFVFASMSDDVLPLTEHLAGATRYIDQWLDRGAGEKVIINNGSMRFTSHSNWKTVYDNAGDGYHPPFSHESMLRVFARRYGDDTDMTYFPSGAEEGPIPMKHLGNGHTLLDQRVAMHAESAWARQHVHPGREVAEAAVIEKYGKEEGTKRLDASTGAGMNLSIFPNLLFLGNQVQLIEPLAVNKTIITFFSTSLEGADEDINAARMRMQEDFPSFGEVDDTAQWESCQEGMETVPELEWIDISRHMTTQAGAVDADGHYYEPVTSDLHMRVYYAEWKRIMERAAEKKAREAKSRERVDA
ncbi:aromatic ring-hydroxylating oxygenase subunit alpha [Roseibium sp. M-1]